MATWGNPHSLQPLQCSTNTATWSETVNTTIKSRTIHITELRIAISDECTRRGLSAPTFTDATLTANSTLVRKCHIDDLRTACENLHKGDCSADVSYCPGDTVTITWTTDPTITANSTLVKDDHINEIRTITNALKTTCICEAEYCQYCSDCGYAWYTCNCQGNSCYCAGDKYSQGCGNNYWNWNCGSINTGGTHPYKSYAPAVAWDNTVPWVMGASGNPPGSDWTAYWSCKCNPFTH